MIAFPLYIRYVSDRSILAISRIVVGCSSVSQKAELYLSLFIMSVYTLKC